MLPNPVAYLVSENGKEPTLPPGKVYGYVMAGNGVFKVAANRYVTAQIPLAMVRIAGLSPLRPYVAPLFGRVPGRVLHRVLADARRRSWEGPREAMYHVVIQDNVLRVLYPPQRGDAGHLDYSGGDDRHIVCDLHSHHEMGAFFSPTDDRDEQGFRFYAVIGRIFSRPEMALRVGVYGDMWQVPITTLFTERGPFSESANERISESANRRGG